MTIANGKLPSCFLILSLLWPVLVLAQPSEDSVYRPYFDCMIRETANYARKTTGTDDAILAAAGSCNEKRDDLLGTIIADLIYSQGKSGYEAERLANAVLDRLDERLRPFLVRAVLDAR